MQPSLLIISQDIVGPTMAGPGIRYWQLARVLSRFVPTTLAAPVTESQPGDTLTAAGFTVAGYRRKEWATLAPHAERASVCLFPSDIADELPELAGLDACLVVDGYDPLMAEWLALSTGMEETARLAGWEQRRVELSGQLALGDFFICASERQRDWWLGLLEANGRINPETYAADPSLRSLVDVVAYGLPSDPLPPAQPVIRGVWPESARQIDCSYGAVVCGPGWIPSRRYAPFQPCWTATRISSWCSQAPATLIRRWPACPIRRKLHAPSPANSVF